MKLEKFSRKAPHSWPEIRKQTFFLSRYSGNSAGKIFQKSSSLMTRNQKFWKKSGKIFQETLWVTTRFLEKFSRIWQYGLRLLRRVKTALGHVSVVLYYVTVSRVGWLVQNKFLIGREKISHLKLSNQLSPPIQSTVSSNNQRPWEINKAQTETCSFFC